ncbi:ATP synthase subunit I [Psychrobacter sp. DM4]|uniref:ATP synthase subunit I n=1 Tax=Psychrobacter sp. DM4 TaxID=3440637 RepID=UPI003F501399
MSKPAKRNQRDQIGRHIKRQVWVLFILIILTWLLDIFWFKSNFLIVKGVSLGALLSFLTQIIFTTFVFRHTGYRARQHIVRQLYRGQAAKWLLTALGFALIFIFIKPLSAPSLFAGFIIMQMSYNWMLLRIN